MSIHDAGVWHGDMEEQPARNVVVAPNGDVRILNFEYAQFHECERKRGPPIVDAFSEEIYDYGCHEMWCLLDDLLWIPGEYWTSPVPSQPHLRHSQTTSILGRALYLYSTLELRKSLSSRQGCHSTIGVSQLLERFGANMLGNGARCLRSRKFWQRLPKRERQNLLMRRRSKRGRWRLPAIMGVWKKTLMRSVLAQ